MDSRAPFDFVSGPWFESLSDGFERELDESNSYREFDSVHRLISTSWLG